MPDRRESTIRFSLDDSVWFETGQGVDELISISLDPHIINMDDEDAEYVILQGALELSGEYKHANGPGEEEFPEIGKRYIQSVEVRNEMESEFYHRFPIEIAIPKRKINDISEVDMLLDSFDYHLKDQTRLQILAEIQIQGIYEELDDEEIETERDEEEITEEPVEEFLAETDDMEEEVEIEVIARTEEPDHTQAEIEVVSKAEEMVYPQAKMEVNYVEGIEQVEAEETDMELVHRKISKAAQEESTNNLYDPFTVMANIVSQAQSNPDWPPKHVQHPFPKLPEVTMDTLAQLTRDYFQSAYNERDHESPSSSYHNEPDIESSSHEIVNEEVEEKAKNKKKKDKYKSMSFADFFARKEEEASTKLKMCFVQHGDSIQGLAEKYNVSAQQILWANQLEANQDVYAGQVLYIPVKNNPLQRK
ncbi:LysM peptidoglycan-binding domain-containing protein [Bacillus sp. FJAT-50079]|uniref:LysM peptidoglycan-binding domain-containing protein n=1 Tax=Bacillus sp. FJAT-50079 TaxID=2833577 RepID=UPI001BC9CA84|nr:LysM peptidoglycan-binding domain-containing protein [Bacillus sp. FJAT-50079]MBS4208937.1 LysM peptidoglycan-binding domain-containing protein [Bacillus sp. FJAT-50079]